MNKFSNLLKFSRVNLNKDFTRVFFLSLISVLIIFAIGVGIIWQNRGKVFNYFAQQYLKEIQNQKEGGDTLSEKIIEKQSIFSQQSLVMDAVKKANPAVVSIVISKNVPKYEAYTDPNQQPANPFGDMFPGFNFPNFFFNVPQYRQNGTEKKEIGSGSGFFISADGLIVTNKHVVDQKDVEYTVFTNDGKKHTAKVVARDPVMDIALIRVENGNYSYLNLGNSDSLQLGQSVIAIGNALGEFRNTVSAGVVSGLARSIRAGDGMGKSETLDHVIQTDAAINPGNSGGPLINSAGQVVGVNVAVASGAQNIGFALPINVVKEMLDNFNQTGQFSRPFLGVRYRMIDQKEAVAKGWIEGAGIVEVVAGSPAEKDGLQPGDIIVKIDNEKLTEKTNLAKIISQKKVGDKVELTVWRNGEEKKVTVVLKEQS